MENNFSKALNLLCEYIEKQLTKNNKITFTPEVVYDSSDVKFVKITDMSQLSNRIYVRTIFEVPGFVKDKELKAKTYFINEDNSVYEPII